ncbi:MAG: DUF1015 domain-containing protein [Actinobacteria bacterium]|nr:DUF1015 domain-containing protein [Actinomycetota bacterium]MBV9932705.1 DUF1015 domain-containing protein [Actinomycetota bacterium]
MPRFEPFAGLRYSSDLPLDEVISPPYDVIDEPERKRLEERNAFNSVRVELPQPDGTLDRYAAAQALLDQWRATGVLVRDDAPSFYVYRMEFADEHGRPRHTTGVLGALELSKPGEGDVLPHERTMSKPKDDRLNLLRAAQANLSPVWGLSMAPGLAKLTAVDGPADAEAVDDDGVRHQLWRVSDPEQLSAISDTVASAPVVIADGHHRFETALAYRDERRAANGDTAGDYDFLMAYIVELVDDELTVEAIHRLINGLPDDFDVLAALDPFFDRAPVGGLPDLGPALGVVTAEGIWRLEPRAETTAQAEHDLDSSRLDVALETFPAHDLSYQHGRELVVAAVDEGRAQAGVLLRPATVAQIAETGRTRTRMPEKTTFFYPKLRTGLVFREVTD